MSTFKSRVLATAAALTLIGGIGTASALTSGTASAATPSCGNACVDLFSQQLSTHHDPSYVLDVFRQKQAAGQQVILFRQANFDPAEDFTAAFQGTVADFFAAGLVSSAVALHYGCTTPAFPVCNAPTQVNDYAFEMEFAPFGVDSGLCVGLAATAVQGEGVTLQQCGTSGKTVWIIDQADSSTARLTPVLNEYVPLINGSDVNFSNPFVLTYPQNGFPTDKPRPQFEVDNLTGFSNPATGDPEGVKSSQMFGADTGILK